MGKLPKKFSDWTPPWEDDDFDSDRAARLVFNARRAEEDALDQVATAEEQITTLNTQLAEEKGRKSGTDAQAQQSITDLTKQVQELEAAKAKLEKDGRPEDQMEIARRDIALETGLSLKQVGRLVGKDHDELLADAKDYAKEHDIVLLGDEDDGDEGGDNGGTGEGGAGNGVPPVQQPRQRYKTGAHEADRINVASDPEGAKVKLAPLFD